MMIHSWQILVAAVAGWVNSELRDVIAYIMEENRVLKEQLDRHRGRRRILLTDDQRRRLAAKAKKIGRKALDEVGCIFTPDTILRWYARLIAMKYDGSGKRRVGRPRKPREIRDLILRMARENLSWGYTRILGALKNLGHRISRSTVRNVMLEHGLDPSPGRARGMSWAEFLAAHWEQIAAADFFTVEVMTLRGLVRYSILFVIRLSTRRVEIAGIAPDPGGEWMKQVARNLTDAATGFVLGMKYFIHDRDPVFTKEFRNILKSAGVQPKKLPAQSPNLNAFAERFVLSIKSECLSRMIFFSEAALRRAVTEYVAHYHEERNHQGLGNELIDPAVDSPTARGPVECRRRLGGLLKFYRRRAS
jgi:transposase InsO family protein